MLKQTAYMMHLRLNCMQEVLIYFCLIANIFAQTAVITDKIINTNGNSKEYPAGKANNLAITAIIDILGIVAINAVTDAGAPS